MVFSIIVPMYNVEQYAERCINSIISQTYKDFELIIVNDGSTDATGEIINRYKDRDTRIKLIAKNNGGLVSARKAGVDVATGEYVVIVDGDDWITNDCLEKINEIISTNDVDVVCCEHFDAFSDDKITKSNLYYKEGLISRDEMCNTIYNDIFCFSPTQWAKAYRRDLYTKFQKNVDDRITMGEDGVVVLPCILNCKNIYITKEALYFYRNNPKSMTRNKQKEGSATGVILRIKHFEEKVPLDQFDMKHQLAGYAVHSSFNVILSYFRANDYNEAKQKANELLSNEIVKKYICSSFATKNKKEQLAAIALRYKLFFLIKLYAVVG